MKSIEIVLPVYNEEKGLEIFNTALFNVLHALKNNYTFTVIYVVDKCSDDSFKVVERLADRFENIIGLELSNRFGHQNSLMAGLSICKGDAVIMMDSDMEHPPEVIPKLLECYENGFEIVYTERLYNEKTGFFKRMTSKLFYKIINWLSTVRIQESTADFRLISEKVLKSLKNDIKEQNPFLRGVLPWMGFLSTKVRYTSGIRVAGKSKYGFVRMLRFGFGGIISFSNKPLMLSIYIGVFFAFMSLLYIVYLLIGYFLGATTPAGWMSTIAFVAFMGSLQLVFLGVVGVYIGKVFEETKKRPSFIIENYTKSFSNTINDGSKQCDKSQCE